MSAFSDTQRGEKSSGPETPRADGFWAQTPAAIVTIAAVVAILLVNGNDPSAPPAQPAAATATAVSLDMPVAAPVKSAAPAAPVTAKTTAAEPAKEAVASDAPASRCADCAVVLSIQQLQGTGDTGFAVEVQMSDGTRRTIRQFAAGFEVGDTVVVNGNALALRR